MKKRVKIVSVVFLFTVLFLAIYYISQQKRINNQNFCMNDTDCVLVLNGCPQCFPCDAISINDERVLAVNKNNYQCPPRDNSVACVACVGSINYNPNKDAICINNKCIKKTKEEAIKGMLEEIFYHSKCYEENLTGFGKIDVEFKIDKIYNTTIMKTGKNYELDFPKGNFTDIYISSNMGEDMVTSPIDYITFEEQNITAWRVQGGIFGNGFAGCLEIMDADSGKILTEGISGYI